MVCESGGLNWCCDGLSVGSFGMEKTVQMSWQESRGAKLAIFLSIFKISFSFLSKNYFWSIFIFNFSSVASEHLHLHQATVGLLHQRPSNHQIYSNFAVLHPHHLQTRAKRRSRRTPLRKVKSLVSSASPKPPHHSLCRL